MDASGSYDELANHYHLIFEDWETSIDRQAAALAFILQHHCGLSSTARILDCACGIGTQALGLAKAGFQVSGCDISRLAVERAEREAFQRRLNIQFSTANMVNLTPVKESDFDAVICLDNALPHLESTDQILQAAAQIRTKLRRGGCVMASIRDYDDLIKTRPTVQEPSFYEDQGQRRIVFQVWDWIDDRLYRFHLYITREFGNKWQTFHVAAECRALRREELTLALCQARFKNVHWLRPAESGFYQPIVLAEAD